MANLAVLRNQGHSGSLWLTHLLNSELDVPAVSHEFNRTMSYTVVLCRVYYLPRTIN